MGCIRMRRASASSFAGFCRKPRNSLPAFGHKNSPDGLRTRSDPPILSVLRIAGRQSRRKRRRRPDPSLPPRRRLACPACVPELQAEHDRLLQRLGLEPEGRKYTPHVTLARLRDSSSRQVAEYLAARGHYRSSSFEVSRFVLFSSRASIGGGPYIVEEAYPLSGPELRRTQRVG